SLEDLPANPLTGVLADLMNGDPQQSLTNSVNTVLSSADPVTEPLILASAQLQQAEAPLAPATTFLSTITAPIAEAGAAPDNPFSGLVERGRRVGLLRKLLG
ncbi:MAG: hypothetical protein V4730_05825, partial [Pseudomonadota bacterium]